MSALVIVILLVFVLPFAFYYLGVIIRSIVFPNKELSMSKRMLVAIITSLFIIIPLIGQIFSQVDNVYNQYNNRDTQLIKENASGGLLKASMGMTTSDFKPLIDFLVQYLQYIFLCLVGGFFVDEGMHSLIKRRDSFIGNRS